MTTTLKAKLAKNAKAKAEVKAADAGVSPATRAAFVAGAGIKRRAPTGKEPKLMDGVRVTPATVDDSSERLTLLAANEASHMKLSYSPAAFRSLLRKLAKQAAAVEKRASTAEDLLVNNDVRPSRKSAARFAAAAQKLVELAASVHNELQVYANA